MKKNLLSFLILAISFTANAQIWCSPNSVWHYNTGNPTFNSAYTKQTYLYDTLVGIVSFNKIKLEKYTVSMSGQNYSRKFLYTSVQNNVVFFNSANSVAALATDTLMYFGPIGAKWRVQPNGGASCAQSFIEITDAGSSIIQGQNVAWRKVNYTNYYMFGNPNVYIISSTDTIFERIGYKKIGFQFLGHCSDFVDANTASFKCFEDYQINFQTATTACDYTTGIKENKFNKFSIYPNPTNSELTIIDDQTIFKDAVIEIKNQLGQTLITMPFTSNINVSQLSAGIYFLSLQNNYIKFIKE